MRKQSRAGTKGVKRGARNATFKEACTLGDGLLKECLLKCFVLGGGGLCFVLEGGGAEISEVKWSEIIMLMGGQSCGKEWSNTK